MGHLVAGLSLEGMTMTVALMKVNIYKALRSRAHFIVGQIYLLEKCTKAIY